MEFNKLQEDYPYLALAKEADEMQTDYRYETITSENISKFNDKISNVTDIETNSKIFSAIDALIPLPPMEWYVTDLISKGSLILLVGEPGSKKTYAMLDLSVCLASGLDWAGLKTQKSKVFYIDEESGNYRLRKRLRNVIRGHGISEDIPLRLSTMNAYNLITADGVKKFEKDIERENPDVVIIDALVDVMSGADENSVMDVQPVFSTLRRIADKYQIAIIVIHHTNKDGGYRGSSAMKGAVDVLLTIKSRDSNPVLDFKSEKVRDSEPIDFKAIANFGEDTFSLSTYKTENKDLTRSTTDDFVYQLFEENGQLSKMEIQDIAAEKGYSSESAKKSIYKLRDLGLVERINSGSKGKKAVFALVSDSKVGK